MYLIEKYRKEKTPKILKAPIFRAPTLLSHVSYIFLISPLLSQDVPLDFMIVLWETLRNFLHHEGLAAGFGHVKRKLQMHQSQMPFPLSTKGDILLLISFLFSPHVS